MHPGKSRADLVIKECLGALAARGAIGAPQSVEYLDSLNRPAHEYKVGKRDSYVIVAQLSGKASFLAFGA